LTGEPTLAIIMKVRKGGEYVRPIVVGAGRQALTLSYDAMRIALR
jgi:hypothetical protein